MNSENHKVSFWNTYYPRESIVFWKRNVCFNQVTLTFQIENDTEIEQYRLS